MPAEAPPRWRGFLLLALEYGAVFDAQLRVAVVAHVHVAARDHVTAERDVALDGEPIARSQRRRAVLEARLEVAQQLEVRAVQVDDRHAPLAFVSEVHPPVVA